MPVTEETKSRPAESWQLQMFRRSLKKPQKLRALLEVMGPVQDQACLLVTCGDNNGALNWHFRQAGGRWNWADAEQESQEQISELTGDPVSRFDKADPRLPFADNFFDLVMAIDVHEHLESPASLNHELARVAKQGGRVVVTTPSGDPSRMANRLKRWVGMRKEDYGHIVDGYDHAALEQQLRQVQLQPGRTASYSGFFTEVIELILNLAFVKIMARRSRAGIQAGQIAPQNRKQMRSVAKPYRLYAWLYPFFLAVSRLDSLGPFRRGHAAIIVATKD
jgi:SAM-dependent methyltransferase